MLVIFHVRCRWQEGSGVRKCTIVKRVKFKTCYSQSRKHGGDAFSEMQKLNGGIQCAQLTISSWNSILSETLRRGQPERTLLLYRQMQEEHVSADVRTFTIALQACCSLPNTDERALDIAMAFHSESKRKGLASHGFVGSALLKLYGRHGRVAEAEHVFGSISNNDVVSWTAMLSAYVHYGHWHMALHMFRYMMMHGIHPTERTFLMALQACCILAENEDETVIDGITVKCLAFNFGQALYLDVLKNGFVDVFTCSTLIALYGKTGQLAESEMVFSEMRQRDVVSWNAMFSSYVVLDEERKALQLYILMQQQGIQPNAVTFVYVLQACCILVEKEKEDMINSSVMKSIAFEIGQALHADAEKHALASEIFVASSLISMYSKCGSISNTEIIFEELATINVETYNAMLSVYIENKHAEKAMFLYDRMQDIGVSVNDVTYSCILKACGETGSLETCLQIHYAIVVTFDACPLLSTTLTHAYGSLASLHDVISVFCAMFHPDIISWNAIIASLGHYGNHPATFLLFEEMLMAGLKPDDVSFLSVLSACNHGGLVHIGIRLLESIRRYFGPSLNSKLYATMVDILGRSGNFGRIDNMLYKVKMWSDLAVRFSLMRACQTHSYASLGKKLFHQAFMEHCKSPPLYVLMSNIHAGLNVMEL